MNTRLLMRGSALFIGLLGLAATFAPQEVLEATGAQADPYIVLLMQLLGAAWAGIAVLNWMAQGNLIGGIYSRPVAMGNFAYFTIAGLALAKVAMAAPQPGILEIALAALHLLFAALFAYVAFTHPKLKKEKKVEV